MNTNDEIKTVPYFVHEGDLARMERSNKRMFILCIILIILFTTTNGAWIWYESQFEDVVTTEVTQDVVQDADDGGNNTFIGSDSYGETTDQKNN